MNNQWAEFCCHPGYASPDFRSVNLTECEMELRTLIDPRVRETLRQMDLRLASFADYTKPQIRV